MPPNAAEIVVVPSEPELGLAAMPLLPALLLIVATPGLDDVHAALLVTSW